MSWVEGLASEGCLVLVDGESMSKITIYDPPSGWMYGFPKQYSPLPGESLKDTLRRDGYPEKLMNVGEHCRFWEQEERDADGS